MIRISTSAPDGQCGRHGPDACRQKQREGHSEDPAGLHDELHNDPGPPMKGLAGASIPTHLSKGGKIVEV